MSATFEGAEPSGSDLAALRKYHGLPDRFPVHGHAIVSADDYIAGPDGLTPPDLRNEADWVRFQAMLDAAVVTVLGRLGHEANPNAARRRRLVLTSGVAVLEEGADAWFWNPSGMPLCEALERVLPAEIHRRGGILAVPGGQPVFDLFLRLGYEEFHLARAGSVRIGEGTRLFRAVGAGRTAADILRHAGLVPGALEVLDPAVDVTLTVWRRADADRG